MITFAHLVETLVIFTVCMGYVAHVSYVPKHAGLPTDWKHEVKGGR